ncbi:MAG: two-component system response regulator [delta proteobacterium ML8_F1]|nr:MAG: two-component system response regulator [delta proteobacterium ML8_F1]
MKHILIVEDEEAIAELQRDYLEIEGYSVQIVTDGAEGLRQGLDGDFDLVILDLMLPGIDGFSVIRELRKSKNVPVIMVSAKGQDIDKIRGLGMGADDYVTKPFSPQELIARVNANLRRYHSMGDSRKAPKELFIGNLTVEVEAKRVYQGKKELILTNKEFDTFLFLAQNPNVVFSKEELFERIWGMESIGDVSTIAVHIRRIREKIEEDPANPKYIETVWGSGYRFKKY